MSESDDSHEIFDSDNENQNTETLNSDKNKSTTFIKLQDNGKTEIRYVYHLSDIHIRRNTERHIEYKEVFDRVYKKLTQLIGDNKKVSIIVITGDIMHAKTELSPEAIKIAYHFFKELSEIATVILIPGNHDCNLSNKNRLDALTPIVEDIGKLDNLYYLKKSGIYQYYNIVFGVTSIFDDVFIPADRITKEIWKSVKQSHKYKIALFHGPVHGAKTDVGYRMNNDELVAQDFDGYDYAMLGDIHRYQYMDENQRIAYSGSLIQQSYGESISNHGILKWDLLDGESEFIEIKNNYGYCTIRIVDGKMVETKIPTKPRIRFILENTTELEYQDIFKKLDKQYQICEHIKDSNFRTKIKNTSHKNKFKGNITAHATQENIIRGYLAKQNLDKDKIDKILAMHKKMYQKVLSDKKDQVADVMHNAVQNQRWRILELRFSNTLSYGRDNVIDFRNYDANKIIGVFAPNHYGKSAILDIILFCLFDRFSRGERRDILNKNQKKMYCSILFCVGSQKYFIERIGQRSKNGLTVKIDVNFFSFILDKKGREIQENLNGLDKNDTNRKIVELVGDYNDYLTTCICLQQGKSANFIDMTQLQKKEYINDILRLNVFEDCHNMAKEKLKKLTAQLKLLEQKVTHKSFDEIKINIKNLSLEIKKLEQQKESIHRAFYRELEYALSILKPDPMTVYHELSEYDLGSEQSILDTIHDITNKLSDKPGEKIAEIQEQLKTQKEILVELEKNSKKINDAAVKNGSDISSLTQQKESLLKKLVNIPKNLDLDVDGFEKDAENITARLKNIKESLTHLKNGEQAEKIERINSLKKTINELRASLKITDKNAQEKLNSLIEKSVDHQKKLMEMIDTDFTFLQKFDLNEKNKILQTIPMKKKLMKYMQKNISMMSQYRSTKDVENDKLIENIIDYNQKIADNCGKWVDWAEKILLQNDEDNVADMIEFSKNLQLQILETAISYMEHIDNLAVDCKIKGLEKKLEVLSEFAGTQKEIDNLLKEQEILQEKQNMIKNKIKQALEYKNHMEKNKLIQQEIDGISTQIKTENIRIKTQETKIETIRTDIRKMEKLIDTHQEKLSQTKNLKQRLVLLQQYYLEYLSWNIKNHYYEYWTKIKNKLDSELSELDKEIEKHKLEMALLKKDLEQYLELRQEFDQISTETNLYQLYVQVMNYNGLPYEMIKTYLPLIESDVNQILHSMVGFNIEFVFFDNDKLEEQKSRQIKTNVGCIDINICYDGMKPYNVLLASGFERFIIGLAIRMTLCQISLTAKPNFFIIDEGWSCLDSENLGNISSIMNYIKMQYDHVIIISHLDQLKNEADYVINIDKTQGYSHITTANTIKTKKKKSREIVVV